MFSSIEGYRYRMPAMFGPMVGPRQRPDGGKFDYAMSRRTISRVSFVTELKALANYTPKGLNVGPDAIVSVEHVVLHEVPWLAGRSYSLVSVKWPVTAGSNGTTFPAQFMPVLWENMAEPILSGRDELGFNKVFCNLPEPRNVPNGRVCNSDWEGTPLACMTLSELADSEPPQNIPPAVVHHVYRPGIGSTSYMDGEEMLAVTPSADAAPQYSFFQKGTGKVEFFELTWEQYPTGFHIINALAALPVKGWLPSVFAETIGTSDLSGQTLMNRV